MFTWIHPSSIVWGSLCSPEFTPQYCVGFAMLTWIHPSVLCGVRYAHLNSPHSIVWGSLCSPEFTPQVLCGVLYARLNSPLKYCAGFAMLTLIHPSSIVWGSLCSLFTFLYSVLCPLFVLFLFVFFGIWFVFSVLRFTDSGYPFLVSLIIYSV
jgi:hypothetical protein